MKLSIIVGVLNQFELAASTIKRMIENLDDKKNTELIVIDNGSDTPFREFMSKGHWPSGVSLDIVRNETNTGNYPLFKQARTIAKGNVVAFLHSDVFVCLKGWDTHLLAQFDANPNLGLVGFIGSTEIDNWGGRGGGTHSNMLGETYAYVAPIGQEQKDLKWTGSNAKVHGKQDGGFIIDGSVVDGCVMIFRKSVLDTIEHREDYPPHHFYDRLMSAQTIELGYKVGILGVPFDHVSGQTANYESKWQTTSREWFRKNLGIESPTEWGKIRQAWVNTANQPSRGKVPDQWDYAAYLEAEYLFLTEYRDRKKIVPAVFGKSVNR